MDKEEKIAEIDKLSQRLESYLPITAKDSLRVAKELYDNGYRKIKDKPPLLNYDEALKWAGCYEKEMSPNYHRQAQRESDIKFYEGK